MDIETFRREGYKAIDRICDYYSSLEKRDVVSGVEVGYLAKAIPNEVPKTGEDLSDIANDFQSLILPGITHWQSPSFFAYFPANATLPSILADLYASSVSNPAFNWSCSPACTELEGIVMDSGAKMLGLDDEFLGASGKGGGIIMGSASESCLTVAIGARERALRIIAQQEEANTNGTFSSHSDPDLINPTIPTHIRSTYTQKLVMYGSTQTHSIGAKAALILGHVWRSIPVEKEDNYSLRGNQLRAAIEEDRAIGLIPFFIIGTVGSTSSGAIDRIGELGEVVKEYPTLFYHVDSAWQGMSYACPEFREEGRLDEVNRYAHSICSNWHKWGLVHFDCSGLWVRHRSLLTSALSLTPEYLRTEQGDAGLVIDYRNWQLSLGRKFRSLKLWFVLRAYGVEGFQAHIRTSVSVGAHLESIVTSTPNFELVTPRALSLLVFRLLPPSPSTTSTTTTTTPIQDAAAATHEANELNRELWSRISARKDFQLTQTLIPGGKKEGGEKIFCIRFALGAPSTRNGHVERAWAVVRELGEELLREKGLI